jgi:hypothetical protein
LKQLHHQEEVGLWLSLGRNASLASNMSPRRKQCHEEKGMSPGTTWHQEEASLHHQEEDAPKLHVHHCRLL